LDIKAVGEGVETEEQYRFLSDHGCDEFQGFVTARQLQLDDDDAFDEAESILSGMLSRRKGWQQRLESPEMRTPLQKTVAHTIAFSRGAQDGLCRQSELSW